MFFLVLGVIMLLAGFAINTPSLAFARFARPIKVSGGVLIVLGLLTASVRQVDAGQVGIVSLFGSVSDRVLLPGLNLVNPVASVTRFDVKTQNYTMSADHDEGVKTGDDAIRVLTADGLEVVVDLTVLYRIIADDAPRIFREIGTDYTDKIVRPVTRPAFVTTLFITKP